MSKLLFDQIFHLLRRAEIAQQHYHTDALKWNLDPHKANHQHLRDMLKLLYEILIPITNVAIMESLQLPDLSQLELNRQFNPQDGLWHNAYSITPMLYELQERETVWLRQLKQHEGPQLDHHIINLRRYTLQFENLLDDLEEAVSIVKD